MQWRFGGIIENQASKIGDQQNEISRLRVALGVDQATPTALISLKNSELKAKALSVVAKLKEIHKEYIDQGTKIEHQANLTDAQKFALEENLAKDLFVQYDQETRSDAFNIDFELRRRLGPQAVSGILGVPPAIVGLDGARINILHVGTAGSSTPIVDIGFIAPLALGIEQMAKMLPQDG